MTHFEKMIKKDMEEQVKYQDWSKILYQVQFYVMNQVRSHLNDTI